MEIISVHIPKTAGVTFRELLRGIYGAKAMHLDYGDRPLDPEALYCRDRTAWLEQAAQERAALRPGIRVAHGHFPIEKYAPHFPAAKKIVWLREPVERLASHYYYWKSLLPGGHSLHRLCVEKNLSLLEFARLEPMRNIVADVFLRGCALEDLDFIGFQQTFAEDLARLASLLGWPPLPPPATENRNADVAYRAFALPDDVRAEIEELNARDMALYARALALRHSSSGRPNSFSTR